MIIFAERIQLFIGMALDRPFLMSFHIGGNIGFMNRSNKREKSTSTNFTVPARQKMSFEEFVDLIYRHVGVEKLKSKLKITLQFEDCAKPKSSLIMNDETLDSMFFLAEKDESFSAQIYVETVEIQRRKLRPMFVVILVLMFLSIGLALDPPKPKVGA